MDYDKGTKQVEEENNNNPQDATPSGFTVDDLKEDKQFLKQASSFLSKRTGNVYLEPEEITSKFMEHFRKGIVNELTLLEDLDYARTADDKSKRQMAYMMDVYESVDADVSWEGAGDFAEGIATAPSTYLGLITGGMGKGAAIGGQQVARTGLKALLKKGIDKANTVGAVPGAIRTGVAGSASGAFSEDILQRTREEVGLGREEGAVTEAALFGGVIGGGLGALAGKRAGRLDTEARGVADKAQETINVSNLKRKQAAERTKKKLKQNPLDKDIVKEGDELLDALNENKALSATLSLETMDAIASSAMQLGKMVKDAIDARAKDVKTGEVVLDKAKAFRNSLGIEDGERITTTVARAITNGLIPKDAYEEVLNAHGITKSQFSAGYTATASTFGKGLQKQAEIKKMFDSMLEMDYIDTPKEEIEKIVAKPNALLEMAKDIDRFRLASMTSQLVTTMRNVAGGGFRLAMDAMDEGTASMLRKLTGQETAATMDATNMAKYMLNTKEAIVVQEMFSQEMPTKARRLFFDAADAEARVGSTTPLAKVGSFLNIVNTKSDEIFKRAAFSASLDRQLRKKGEKGVIDLISEGRFNEIDEGIIQKAIDDSLYFAYQKTPSKDTTLGRGANFVIDAHREFPFLVSGFAGIPFPRFVANQIQFVYEHSPLLPMLGKAIAKRELPDADDLAKQVTGSALFMSCYAYRTTQDASTNWDEYVNEDGTVSNYGPMMGPIAPFMIMADLLVRLNRNDPVPSVNRYATDALQALGTPRFNQSFGIPAMDRVWEDFGDGKVSRGLGRLAGDVMGTFLIPGAMVRDFASVYNEDLAYIKNMEVVLPASEEEGLTGSMINFLDYAAHHATKNFPTAPSEEERRKSITAGELRRVNPIERQLLGRERYAPKTVLQKELDRLQLDRSQLVNVGNDPIRKKLTEEFLSERLPDMLRSFIDSEDYQRLPDTEKGRQLRGMASLAAREMDVKGFVDNEMSRMIAKDRDIPYYQLFREQYENLPNDVRRSLNERWKNSPEYNGKSIQEAGAFHWAMSRAKDFTDVRFD